MIKRINTENGERWAIVFENENTTLEDLTTLQRGLVDLMITGTGSDLFDSANMDYHSGLSILREFIPTPEQSFDIEKRLLPQN